MSYKTHPEHELRDLMAAVVRAVKRQELWANNRQAGARGHTKHHPKMQTDRPNNVDGASS
ncbi:MAG: hypothetical protein K8T25_21720 [Planctomycetia bacterium]|nr:hypothetical protein [Planctomycetia bacterium]